MEIVLPHSMIDTDLDIFSCAFMPFFLCHVFVCYTCYHLLQMFSESYELMKEERLNGRREGKREGEKAGKKKERFSIVRKMHKKGMEEAQIRELTGCTKKEFAAATGR